MFSSKEGGAKESAKIHHSPSIRFLLTAGFTFTGLLPVACYPKPWAKIGKKSDICKN